MSPPTEQLISDYLNRLSVAARGQLGPGDRRALVNRTRDFIERKTSLAGPPTAVEVARLLAGLGDPGGLVQQERQRLAAVRGELAEPGAGRSRIARALRRDPARVRSASWHWPALEGSRADLQITLLDNGNAGTDAHDDAEEPGSASGTATAMPGGNGVTSNGVPHKEHAADEAEPSVLVPPQAGGASWLLDALSDPAPDVPEESPPEPVPAETPERGAAAAVPPKPRWPLVALRHEVNGSTREQSAPASAAAGDAEPTSATPAWQLTTPSDPVVSRQVRRALRAIASWYRRTPLEASAVLLLGLGGVIYPPIWLAGAIVALASRLWDYKDKWLGLALPLVLTLVGIAVGAARGGHDSMGQGIHEGWVYGVVASRVAAALSACYLGWRSVHGRRRSAVPPWNRPRKIG